MKTVMLFYLLLLFQTSYSQEIRRTIIDAISATPIPYATVKVLKTNRGQIASVNGEINIEIKESDFILITSVGYYDTILAGNRIGQKIKLTPKERVLKELIVKTKKVLDKFLIGNGVDFFQKNIKCSYTPGVDKGCLPWGAGAGAEFVEPMELPDTIRSYQLKKLYLPLKRLNCFEKMFLNIYDIDSAGKPGSLIFRKPLLLNSEEFDKGKVILSLESDNIYFDGIKKFFIGLSWDTENSDKSCTTLIILMSSTKGITYNRTLVQEDYNWFLFHGSNRKENGIPVRYHTIFAAEIEVLED